MENYKISNTIVLGSFILTVCAVIIDFLGSRHCGDNNTSLRSANVSSSFANLKLSECLKSRTETWQLSRNVSDLKEIVPEQVHLAWNGVANKMTITWSTAQLENTDTFHTIAVWGKHPSKLNRCTGGNAWKFTDGGEQKRAQYMHLVTLHIDNDFESNATGNFLYYRIGSQSILSKLTYKFRPISTLLAAPRVLIVGDVGTLNSRSLIEMTKQAVQQNQFDLILHNGDFAYDMADDNGQNGDAFMRLIEPIAANVPYQTAVGNHEHHYNFSHYINRFGKAMPGNADGLYYAMNLGPAYFIVISTEFYYYPADGVDQVSVQLHWLEHELRKLRTEINTTQWIVVFGHRPIYCSAFDPIGCDPHTSVLRSGTGALGGPNLEQLFRKYGVDLYVGSHNHWYERMWPVFDMQVMNGTAVASSPYTDALATVYIVSGSGGQKWGQLFPEHRPLSFKAFNSSDHGFTRLTVHNATHMHLDQVSIENGGNVIDEMWLKRTEPMPAWLRGRDSKNIQASHSVGTEEASEQ